jgi:acetoin utilization deacetylase AcuC-like enzyme
MAALVRKLARAAEAPLGLVLEGGYNSRVLAECVCAILPILTGASAEHTPDAAATRGHASEDERSQIARAAAQVGRYWQL